MPKCPRCLRLDREPVATEPHETLGEKSVATLTGGTEERYTCATCKTKWRRFISNATFGKKDYRWTAIG